jgi:hypothetical protein
MGFLKVLCFFLSFLTLGLNNSNGQTWLWAEDGFGTNGIGATPILAKLCLVSD